MHKYSYFVQFGYSKCHIMDNNSFSGFWRRVEPTLVKYFSHFRLQDACGCLYMKKNTPVFFHLQFALTIYFSPTRIALCSCIDQQRRRRSISIRLLSSVRKALIYLKRVQFRAKRKNHTGLWYVKVASESASSVFGLFFLRSFKNEIGWNSSLKCTLQDWSLDDEKWNRSWRFE